MSYSELFSFLEPGNSDVDEIPSVAIARLWEIANRNTKLSVLDTLFDCLTRTRLVNLLGR